MVGVVKRLPTREVTLKVTLWVVPALLSASHSAIVTQRPANQGCECVESIDGRPERDIRVREPALPRPQSS
jgi:hypothetical protein